jgi:sugar fermentation stimulation protein A
MGQDMKYENMINGIFIERPNRFIAHVEINGKLEVCHVKNTGRCKELLTDGASVLVQACGNPGRKTKYDLISVWKGDRLINMDSQVPNHLFREWVEMSGYFQNVTLIKSEKKYGNSRFDFYLETQSRKIYVEVKGVTLEEEGVARFPDAPTERGVKHLKTLMATMEEGFEAMVVFMIQMKGIQYLVPNDVMHPAFGEALRALRGRGADILAIDCLVTGDAIFPGDLVEVRL